VTSGGSEKRVINSPKRRTANLTAQDIEVMTEDRQLDVPEATHHADPPNPARGRPG
jgi:hypothetical protein